MELFDKTKFKTQDELFKFLVDNKESLIATKKAAIKYADGIPVGDVKTCSIADTVKANGDAIEKGTLEVTAIINTTKVFDSHDDVHIDGLWDKSLNENKNILHIQEHKMSFDKIIASKDDLNAVANEYSFKQLGFDYEGMTEALTFLSTVKQSRNEFMYNEYKDGNVDNHSVGMRYMKIVLCVNSEDEYYGAEKEAWDKYFPQIVVGAEAAEKQGYFWAVTEAKVIEGSAVPIGSNTVTPTLSVKGEPSGDTHQEADLEPFRDTLKAAFEVDAFRNIISETLKN